MKFIGVVVLMMYQFLVNGQQTGISFIPGSFNSAVHLAKEQDKPLFIFLYFPSCNFCQRMEKQVFARAEAGDYYNAHFINDSLNIEAGEGQALADRFNIRGYPTYLYFDIGGKLLHISSGEKSAGAFVQDAKDAMNPAASFAGLRETYLSAQRSPDLLYRFASVLAHTSLPTDTLNLVTREYLHSQTNDELLSEKNLRFIYEQAYRFNDPVVPYYFKFQKQLKRIFDGNEISKKNRDIIAYAASDAAVPKNQARMDSLRLFLRDFDSPDRAQLKDMAELKYLLGIFISTKKRGKELADTALRYTKKYAGIDKFSPREVATYLKYYGTTKDDWTRAEQIMSVAIAKDPSVFNLLLQSQLFQKTVDNKKALTLARRALAAAAAAHEDGSDVKEQISLLEGKKK